MTIATVDVNFPVGTNIDLFDVGMLTLGTVVGQTSTSYGVAIGDETVTFTGTGFTYTSGQPAGGTITGIQDSYFGAPVFNMQGFSIPVSTFNAWAAAHDNLAAQTTIFASDDTITGGPLEDLLRGYAGNDLIQSGGGADTLDGGTGADTIDGGAGGDLITTGGGADVIVIGQAQSLNIWNQTDVVTDWSSSDTVRFAHMSGDATAYAEGSAADYGSATTFANNLIASGSVNVVAVQIGSDVAVFADSADDNGSVDDLVVLSGRTLADVSASNFGLAAAPPPPPPVNQPPAAPTGLALDAASDSGVKGDGITSIAKITVTGVAEHGASVSVYDGATLVGSSVADATTGAFSFTTTSALADGAHSLTARAATSAGQSPDSAAFQVTVDTHAGVSAIEGFTEVAAGKKLTVTLTGTASDATSGVSSVGIFQDGVSIGSVKPTGADWSFTRTNVTDAVHTYTTQATDAAGNVGAVGSPLILGSSGADKIVGGATNDIIHGDSGADTLTGGAGADVFVYDSLNDALAAKGRATAVDTITDFQNGTDRLDLSDLGHMTFKGQSSTLAAHEVSWYVSGGNTFVIGDVTGDGKSDFIIQLSGTHAMTGSDFLLG
jgi:Ca2+-binding RTX toxin-like protein